MHRELVHPLQREYAITEIPSERAKPSIHQALIRKYEMSPKAIKGAPTPPTHEAGATGRWRAMAPSHRTHRNHIACPSRGRDSQAQNAAHAEKGEAFNSKYTGAATAPQKRKKAVEDNITKQLRS